MYLKRLELRGFKTFALYTDFMFDAGITAIVGPNGSGKSNIADAVRWVLGEQTYSALRAKRTEDMIFAGTSRRPQLGMAEAVMTLDNTSGWLPIDFNEVTIARRAYRSGENHYFLNGSRVRLRDMVELLGKAGLGRGGFVVIGQGLVDAALSLRPEERRTLFEEAAGIHIYRERREEAMAKLAETQQNILRVNDIINEITPHLRDLERQAKRAEERELLQRDLEKLLRIWYGYHWQRLQAKLTEAESLLRWRLEEVGLGRARLQEVEALISSTQARQNELRRQLSIWHKASSDLHSQAEAKGRELAVSRERLSQLQQRRAELQAELEQQQARRTTLQESITVVQAELKRLQDEAQVQSTRLQELRARWQTIESARAQAERAVEQAREESFRHTAALADIHNRLKQFHERCAQIQSEQTEQQRELESVEDQVSALQVKLTQAIQRYEEASRSLDAVKTRQAQLQKQATALAEEMEQRRFALSEITRKRQRLEDRRDMLQGLRQSMAGFGPGVKAVLEAKGQLTGIIGPVAGLLRVPQKLERAVEVALGVHTQSLVVERWEDASLAIDLLRKKALGRATFLPLDTLTASPVDKAPSGAGVLGLAKDLVEYDACFETVVQLLLGSAVIVEDLPTARRLRSQLHGGQRLVTLAGEVVRASGMLTGGAEGGRFSLLAQEREWRELPEQLATLEHKESIAKAAVQEVEQQHLVCRQDLKAAENEAIRLSRECEALELELASLRQKLERLQQESSWRLRLVEQQKCELQMLQEKAAALQQEANERAREHGQRKANLDALLVALEQARADEEAARQAMAQSETAVAIAERQGKMHEQLLTSQCANLERLDQEMAARSARLAALQRESEQLKAVVGILQQDVNEILARIAGLAAQLDPAEAEVLTLENQLASLEQEHARARQRLSELEALYNQQVLEKERQQDALEAMEHRIEEDLGDIEYPTERVQQLRMEFLGQDRQALTPVNILPESLSMEIKDLKARLRRIGPVNPAAPQEYQEALQRHQFLSTQMKDLQDSSTALQEVIKELDNVMEKEFLSVFNASAAEFSRYFEHLFGGGQAKLTLTDPESPSTTGVEIIARPPGKRLQTLALLSGGERALTAAALLFAVLKVKPIPFCILDEVDAMLDEANVGRFRDALQELTTQTQFIVISHNRATIEAANTIYGVSMTEEGISKVLSLQLKERLTVNG